MPRQETERNRLQQRAAIAEVRDASTGTVYRIVSGRDLSSREVAEIVGIHAAGAAMPDDDGVVVIDLRDGGAGRVVRG